MTTVYKLLRAPEWAAFQAAGRFAGSPDDLRDGYIHMSTAEQVPGTRARYFADQPDAVLLAIDAGALGGALRWEPSRGGALFPHLYRPLDLSEVQPVPLSPP
jgi:uncharacterized protein (DUF952 family)